MIKHLITALLLLFALPGLAQVSTYRWPIYRGNSAEYVIAVPASDAATQYSAVGYFNRNMNKLPVELQPAVEHGLTSVTVRFTNAQTKALPEQSFVQLKRENNTVVDWDVPTGTTVASRPGTVTLIVGGPAVAAAVTDDSIWAQLLALLLY